MNRGKRLRYLDIAKGIAIIAVLLGHEVSFLMQGGAGTLMTPVSMRNLMIFVDQFHMPVFFLVAGVFAEQSLKPGLKTLRKIACRLMVPYFLWIFLLTLALQVTQFLTGKDPQWRRFLESPLRSFGQFWFLYALFLCEVLFWILRTLLTDLKRVRILFAVLSLLFLAVYPHIKAPEQITGLFRNLIFFSGGLSLSSYVRNPQERWKRWHFILAGLLFLCSMLILKADLFHGDWVYWIVLRSAGGMGGALSCVFLSHLLDSYGHNRIIGSVDHALSCLGQISLEIYCINPFLTEVFRMAAQRLCGSEWLWPRALLITAATVSAAAIVMGVIPEENVLVRIAFGKGIQKRRTM